MISRVLKRILAVISLTINIAVVGALAVYFYQRTPGSDLQLQPWHLAQLEEEFRASAADGFRELDDYRRLEDRLFDQLRERVYQRSPATTPRGPSRFRAGGPADPGGSEVNWNRTFEMPVEEPLGAVLLLHGLLDSPYSMRPLAETLHEQGFWVVGLRIPGHGTAPAGLVGIGWQDFAAASRLAAGYLSRRVGTDRPLFLVGHSLGAALALEYSLAVLQGEELPPAQALVLISPAIGKTLTAEGVASQNNLTPLPDVNESDWLSVLPEFDPYRYNSLARNASVQLDELNRVIAERLERLAQDTGRVALPRVLAFQSMADSAVSADVLANGLLRALKPIGHELVVFDLNRRAEVTPFLNVATADLIGELMIDDQLPFDLTLVTNRGVETSRVMARRKSARSTRIREQALGMVWPHGVYSLSSVGLPLPPDDPVYGASSRANGSVLALGDLELRGEPDLLAVPGLCLNRLRYNPFFAYLEHRVVRTLTDIARGR